MASMLPRKRPPRRTPTTYQEAKSNLLDPNAAARVRYEGFADFDEKATSFARRVGGRVRKYCCGRDVPIVPLLFGSAVSGRFFEDGLKAKPGTLNGMRFTLAGRAYIHALEIELVNSLIEEAVKNLSDVSIYPPDAVGLVVVQTALHGTGQVRRYTTLDSECIS